MKQVKLRDSGKLKMQELYPINEFPEKLIKLIGRQIVYLKFVGRKDLSGDDWGDIFASAIDGTHLKSPVGIADVIHNKMAWSMKTIKNSIPHTTKSKPRLIIGRNSTDFSLGIPDPHKDIQATGNAVLQIWNKRVDIAYQDFTTVRTAILIRNFEDLTFTLFEEDTRRFVPSEYEWEENDSGNFEGYEIETQQHRFTWQPSGSQFSIYTHIPKNAFKFRIKKPPLIDVNKTLEQINYTDDWVEIL